MQNTRRRRDAKMFFSKVRRFVDGNKKGKKVNFSSYRPGVAQRVGRGIALLFHDRGTRSG